MSSLEQLRASVIHESDLIASKKRFGLFSQPISTAIGDSSPYQTKICTVNSMQTRGMRLANRSPNLAISTSLQSKADSSGNPTLDS